MARRIKEEPDIHRKRIADSAEKLFRDKGIEGTSMSEVAKITSYSKATLYVYFDNKEQLVTYLVYRSMVKLNEYISDGIEKGNNSREKYLGICHGVIKYAEQYPIYFNMTTDFINIDMDKARYVKTERDTKKFLWHLFFRFGECCLE